MNEAAYRAILTRLGVEVEEEVKPTVPPLAQRVGDAEILPEMPTIPRPYAFPWPDEVPGLGARRARAFEPCAECGEGSWVRYGEATLCLKCALRLARGSA